jgi:hypothetical protein
MLWFGLLGLGILVVLSFSRRSGPVRDLPPPARATPIEFLEALGSLYGKAGAASTAVAIAWERFRRHSLRLCGQRPIKMYASELAAVIRRRFPAVDSDLEADLAACEEGARDESATPREALKLVQILHRRHDELMEAARLGPQLGRQTGRQTKNRDAQPKDIHSQPQERAS